ncbi:Major facilitator superfamily domain-containing protein 4A [Halotydeus destructor]|nr:Major facilitator superfamily domain-containing protein 4A [Halotydeus destructor]
MFLFTLLGFETGMGSFITSFAVMSDHHLTTQVGAYMTSLFWFTFTFTRLLSIPFIEKIGMYRNITIELGILVIANTFLVPFGNSVLWCLWVGISLVGVGVSTLWGALFVLLESHFPVTGGMGSLLVISSCVGEWVYPVIMGYALESHAQLETESPLAGRVGQKMADTKCILYVKTAALCLSFFTIGMVIAIIGPTILELQCAVGVTYENIIKILPARASGYAFGSLIVGVLYDRLNPLLTFAITLTTTGICTILMPYATSLVTLLIIAFLCNLGGGMIDAITNVFILYIWGKESQPYMQAIHCAVGVGGLVAPLLASPFMSAGEAPVEGLARNVTSATENSCHPESLRINIPYAILGACCFLSALVHLYLFCYYRHTDEHPSRQVQAGEDGLNGDKSDLIWTKRLVVAVAAMFLFSLLGLEIGMGSFITSFAVMSDHHLTTQMGAYVTSLYWFTFTFFRMLAIPVIEKIGMYRNITIELGILVIANMFLLPFGNSVSWCLWVGIALVGIGLSTLWGALFVLLESYFPVTSRIGSILVVSSCLGEWVFPVIMGYALESHAQLFLWVIFVITVICCTLFAILSLLCKMRLEPKKASPAGASVAHALS